jgi:beta-aspartyl-peptidase (threonine type)
MDAAIMNGKDRSAGAVCLVENVKNPITLARAVMEKTPHVYLGGEGALELAENLGLPTLPAAYFITENAFKQWQEANAESENPAPFIASTLGTVGAVALDSEGNIAAATSTGGIENKMVGRIGDTSVIGSGCYADNSTCAVSCTGDGEIILQGGGCLPVGGFDTVQGIVS